ncbi:hypothetical protein DBY65_009990 [Pseudomonas sp. RIT412]|nr:hypothetical protein DBP26_008980 [Pseudomonas sp. RIT 409]RAU54634.1 hypothetical protein DBY65_009990 [Pseudomonas sp. RIT 412]
MCFARHLRVPFSFQRHVPVENFFFAQPCNHLARPYVWVTVRFLAHFARPYSAVRSRAAPGKSGTF